MLFIFGRYFLRFGDPSDPPAQGAEVSSLRGGGIFTLEHPLDSTTRDWIMISEINGGLLLHSLIVNNVEQRSSSAPIRPELLEAAKQFRQAWCQQTALPPTPAPTVETYRIDLSCTALTGRVFYFSREQLPTVIVDLLQEAPPLAPR
jgi:hypothetical protein